jgi:hypothetical protein
MIQLLNAKFVINNLFISSQESKYRNQQGVCHTVALPFYIKRYLNAKEKL